MRRWLVAPIHVSWRIAALAFGIVVGVPLALVLPTCLADKLVIFASSLLLCVALRWPCRWLVLAAFSAGALFGIWRGASQQVDRHLYSHYYGQVLSIEGVLHEDPSLGPHGEQRFILQHISIKNRTLPAEVWVSSANKADIKRGDRLVVEGRLTEGFSVLPAAMYRASVLSIYRPHPGDIARRVRDTFADAVRDNLPEPQASLGIGYLTGQRSSLPPEFDEQLRVTGLTHAVVASGYNLTILVSFARTALAQVSKYLAATAAGLLVGCFMAVTGLSPSMSRAGLVAGVGLLVWYYGRTVHPCILLIVAAAITVVIRPAYAWGDLGWCLSFAAFGGVLILAPLVRSYFWAAGDDPPLPIQIFVDTMAAQLATLPILLYAFGQYSVYALPANIMVLPLVPLAMACVFVAGVGALIVPGAGAILALPAEWLLSYMVWIVRNIAAWPGAQLEIHFSLNMLISSYAILSMLSFCLWRRTALDFRGGNAAKKF